MLVVLARDADPAAAALLARGAVHLKPSDVSRPGWVFDPHHPRDGTFVASGTQFAVREARAILTLMPAVVEADLPHIRVVDRAYAAREMTAFLLAWLSAMPWRQLNRATPTCLAGPVFPAREWMSVAADAGLAAAPGRRRASIAVVGSRC